MSAVFALLAALCNAVYVATQHVASTSSPVRVSGVRLVAYLLRSPLWLFGLAVGIGAFVCQAVALRHGQVSIVQTLLVTELVFGLVLRKLWIGQSIRAAAWAAAALTCAGLGAFVAIDEPQGGVPSPTTRAWVSAVLAWGGAAALMALAARFGSPARRAALYASAAAIIWALEATFIKAAVETLSAAGLGATFMRWPIYAVAAGGVAGTVLVQAALHVGPLSVSQPLLTIVDPAVSTILSVWLFQEHYTRSPLSVASSVLAFAVMCAGVLALTKLAPPTMRPLDAS